AAFSGLQGFVDGKTLQITAVITDVNGNATPGTQSGTTLLVDVTVPLANTVGSLITTGGTVLASKWNSTNTGLNVTVPMSNSDATLDGGKIQLQVQNTT